MIRARATQLEPEPAGGLPGAPGAGANVVDPLPGAARARGTSAHVRSAVASGEHVRRDAGPLRCGRVRHPGRCCRSRPASWRSRGVRGLCIDVGVDAVAEEGEEAFAWLAWVFELLRRGGSGHARRRGRGRRPEGVAARRRGGAGDESAGDAGIVAVRGAVGPAVRSALRSRPTGRLQRSRRRSISSSAASVRRASTIASKAAPCSAPRYVARRRRPPTRASGTRCSRGRRIGRRAAGASSGTGASQP